MSIGWCNSFYKIICHNDKDKLINDIKNKYQHLWTININGDEIILFLTDSDIYRDHDLELEEFAKWLKDNYGLEIYGYAFENMDDGYCYRSEFRNGKIIRTDLNWLLDYDIDQINELKKIAEDKFDSEKYEVELFCKKCGKNQLVIADMYQLEYFRTNILRNKDGECYINWDNADVSGDFNYICEKCGESLGSDLDEIKKIISKN